jgi:hypothetical protein
LLIREILDAETLGDAKAAAVRLKAMSEPRHLTLAVKGFDRLEEVKGAAAERWVSAVNADASYGEWRYRMVKKVTSVDSAIESALTAKTPNNGGC